MSGTAARLLMEGINGKLDVSRMRGREELSGLFELATTLSSATDVSPLQAGLSERRFSALASAWASQIQKDPMLGAAYLKAIRGGTK